MGKDRQNMADNTLSGWERFFGELSSFLADINRQQGTANEDFSEFVVDRLEMCIVSVSRLVHHLRSTDPLDSVASTIGAQYSTYLDELLDCLRIILRQWQNYLNHYQTRNESSFSVSVTHTTQRGRPRFDISQNQLHYLHSMRFTWVQIASILGVSYMTVYRRRQEYEMLDDPTGNVTDNDLHQIIQQMKTELPALGQTLVWGRLRSMGLNVTRARVRQAMRVSDPIHTALRWSEITPRRPYSVPGPNSLWHVDGHHKLIRWRMVTHCAIDGYSRLVVFLKCSNNNRADTVYSLFLEAVSQYGLPSRVRCDQGRENIRVAQHLLHHRGVERRSVLVGSSVHNQRIERLWKDSHRCITSMFYRLFYYLEYNEFLDPITEEHLFALHYVFLPRINRALQQFRAAWNDHGVRTEGGQTPNQLFTAGALRLQNSGLPAFDFFQMVPDHYGTEEEGIAPEEDESDSGVEVPPLAIQLTELQLLQLRSTVDPLENSDDFGISLYIRTLQVLRSWLS